MILSQLSSFLLEVKFKLAVKSELSPWIALQMDGDEGVGHQRSVATGEGSEQCFGEH